jgi:hypothetical protein
MPCFDSIDACKLFDSDYGSFAIRILIAIYNSGLFHGRIITCIRDLNMFVSDTQCLSCVMHVLGVNHVCMNAYYVCCFFGDRFERLVCGGRGGI